ncbi:BnaC08g41600D, partial [Brassica napus]
NENIEVGITLFVLYHKRKEDIDLPTGEKLIIIGINLVRLSFFDRFFSIDRALMNVHPSMKNQ